MTLKEISTLWTWPRLTEFEAQQTRVLLSLTCTGDMVRVPSPNPAAGMEILLSIMRYTKLLLPKLRAHRNVGGGKPVAMQGRLTDEPAITSTSG